MNIDSMAARAQILLHAHAAGNTRAANESSQKALGAARNYHSDATYLIIIAAGEKATQIFTAADLSAAADCPAIRACVLIADALTFSIRPLRD